MEGILTHKAKQLIWESNDKSKRILINVEDIADICTAENLKKNSELLKILTHQSQDQVHYIFYFLDDRRELRDKFFQLLNKKENEHEDNFKLSSLYDKKKILKIFNDEYLSYIFEELVIKKPILIKDEFLSFIKRKYSYKFDFTTSVNAIQLLSKY